MNVEHRSAPDLPLDPTSCPVPDVPPAVDAMATFLVQVHNRPASQALTEARSLLELGADYDAWHTERHPVEQPPGFKLFTTSTPTPDTGTTPDTAPGTGTGTEPSTHPDNDNDRHRASTDDGAYSNWADGHGHGDGDGEGWGALLGPTPAWRDDATTPPEADRPDTAHAGIVRSVVEDHLNTLRPIRSITVIVGVGSGLTWGAGHVAGVDWDPLLWITGTATVIAVMVLTMIRTAAGIGRRAAEQINADEARRAARAITTTTSSTPPRPAH